MSSDGEALALPEGRVLTAALSPCRQAYENCVVLEARICYNVAKLMALNAER